MEEILKINNVDDYNKLFGLETRHPLVSVVDLSQSTQWPTQAIFNYGIYALFLKDIKCGDIRYGRQFYDYQDGTIVSFGPGQITGIDMAPGVRPMAHGLLFHPDLIRGTALGQEIRNYTFFSYEVNEALHLSEEERQTIIDCLNKIQAELEHAIDKHSRRLITANIGVLLDYCLRFYDRQFITRKKENKDTLSTFEALLNDYFTSDKPQLFGTPTVAYCAEKLHLSANYFGDLIKKVTGSSAQEYILSKIMDTAKELLADPAKSISDVAYALGYQYPQYFSRAFKRIVGYSPNEYRTLRKTLL